MLNLKEFLVIMVGQQRSAKNIKILFNKEKSIYQKNTF